MTIKLPPSLTSVQDLKAAILEIRRYAQWYSQASVKVRVTRGKTAGAPAISQPAIDLIEQWHADRPVRPQDLDDLIAALEDFAASASSITITLAAPPSQALRQALLDWCRQNIDPNILADFRFNSTMLGGLMVRYGSHVYDWSFRRQILEARQKFPEALRHV